MLVVRVCLVDYQAFLALLPSNKNTRNISYDEKKELIQCLADGKTPSSGRQDVKRYFQRVVGGEDPLDLEKKDTHKIVLPLEFLWTVIAMKFPIFLFQNTHRLDTLTPRQIKREFLSYLDIDFFYGHDFVEKHLISSSGRTVVPVSVPSAQEQQLLLKALMKANLKGDAGNIVMRLQSAGLPAPRLASNTNNNNNNSSSSGPAALEGPGESQQIIPATHTALANSFSQMHLSGSAPHRGNPAGCGIGPGIASIPGWPGFPFPAPSAHSFSFPAPSAHGGLAFSDIHHPHFQNFSLSGPLNGFPAGFVGNTTGGPVPMIAPPLRDNRSFRLPREAMRAAAQDVAQEVLTHVVPLFEEVRDGQREVQREVRDGQREVVATLKASAEKSNDPPKQNDSAATVKASAEESNGPPKQNNSAVEDTTDTDTPPLVEDPHHDGNEDYDYNSEPWVETYTDESLRLLWDSNSEEVDVDAILRTIVQEPERPPCLDLDFFDGNGINENALATKLSSPTSAFRGHTTTSIKWTQTPTGKLLYQIRPAHCYQYVRTESNEDKWQTVSNVEKIRLVLRADQAVAVEHLDDMDQVMYSGNLVWKDDKVAQKYIGLHPITNHGKGAVETMLVIQSMCLNANNSKRLRSFLFDFWEKSDTYAVRELTRESLLDPAV